MQTLILSSHGRGGQLRDAKTSMRLRVSRFLSERYTQRERPGVAAEFLLLALIVLTAIWPMFTLAHALGLNR
ncbi:MAG: hypothetical protein WCE51_10325 [Chthoniobacterales bacterium]